MFRLEKTKLMPSDKLTIGEDTRTVLQWVKYHPLLIKGYIYQNRDSVSLSAHLELELKASINEQNKRSDSKRSS